MKNNREAGTCVRKTSCESCGSSDAVQVYQQTDGSENGYCFACDTYIHNIKKGTPMQKQHTSTLKISDVNELPSLALEDRGLRQEIVEFFGVKVGFSPTGKGTISKHFYPSHSPQGELRGYKQRNIETKDFYNIGNVKNSAFFGQNVCPMGKKIFITEGELDALSLHQVLRDTNPVKYKDSIPSVVSVSNGASGAAKQCVAQSEWLQKFQEVVLVFDNDEPGRKASESVAKMLEHKCIRVANLDLKDANEMLLKNKLLELRHGVLQHAQIYQPDGIVNASTAWDRYKERNTAESYPYPPAFEDLNAKTYGWRFGSVITLTSGSGSGKTQLVREIKYHILKTTEFKIADIALEEDIGDTIEGLMALELNKRISLPDVAVSEEEERTAFDTLFKEGRLELYDHFGGMNDDSLFSRIRYFNKYLGCRVFTLDHLSIIISETADEGDERRRIDSLMTKLTILAKSLDIVIFLVVHLKKAQQGKSFEEGHVATADDLRGSASIKQLSFDIITIARNQQDTDPIRRNTSAIHVLKCRYSGHTGPAGFVQFDNNTGRMIKTTDPEQGDEFDEESKF